MSVGLSGFVCVSFVCEGCMCVEVCIYVKYGGHPPSCHVSQMSFSGKVGEPMRIEILYFHVVFRINIGL